MLQSIRKLGPPLVLLLVFRVAALGQDVYFVPHVIGGHTDTISWRTDFEFANASGSEDVTVTISLFDELGQPLNGLPYGGKFLVPVSSHTFSLSASRVARLSTTSVRDLFHGWVRIESSAPITVAAVLTQEDSFLALLSATTLSVDPPAEYFVFPADVRTGIAILNTSPTNSATVTVELISPVQATPPESVTLDLPAGMKIAQFLAEPGLFPGFSSFTIHTVRIESSQPLAVTALRVLGSTWVATQPAFASSAP